jgi:predicted MarR family transcription regulator
MNRLTGNSDRRLRAIPSPVSRYDPTVAQLTGVKETGVKELARSMNRDDIPNIQYSLRKLIAGGLVERSGSARAGVTYSATARGRAVTEKYAGIRRALLIATIENVPGFVDRPGEATRTFKRLAGIYGKVSRVAATHRRPPGRLAE